MNEVYKRYVLSYEIDAIDIKIISKVLIDRMLDRHLSVSRDMLAELATLVVEVFPTENVSTWFYYNPHVSKNPRGKLYDRYHNETARRRKIRKAHLLLPNNQDNDVLANQPAAPDDYISVELTEEIERKIEWLRFSSNPWTQVVEYWVQTEYFRKQLILSSTPLKLILKQWPLLLHDNGHALVSIQL